ncbi:Uncharacterised protein [Mycobacteroides abscessus subsp. abscessus]|nr:Uncharacterised protein [Mycobacteroides abscessus]SHU89985.1 Uncharacterised protein [Mycobacteroides abscessus subsp. abscessus]CPX16169.1 Uncharacterised protein [Mycobacteroides abscessus]CPZ43707.1 Uncharacterised protein [Mycobacteroides abscessus]CQA11251.1 Uncharacterised protein [Mycobacteroides abscessus]
MVARKLAWRVDMAFKTKTLSLLVSPMWGNSIWVARFSRNLVLKERSHQWSIPQSPDPIF